MRGVAHFRAFTQVPALCRPPRVKPGSREMYYGLNFDVLDARATALDMKSYMCADGISTLSNPAHGDSKHGASAFMLVALMDDGIMTNDHNPDAFEARRRLAS